VLGTTEQLSTAQAEFMLLSIFRSEGALINHIYLDFCCYIFLEHFSLHIILLFVSNIATLKNIHITQHGYRLATGLGCVLIIS